MSPAMVPYPLALEPDPVLAWLHVPEPADARATAVLMCPPFGWDEVCSHRALWRWARALAQAGYPAARLSLPSTGESAGSPRDAARLEAWTAAITGASRWLREVTDARRVVALGIGLGGMLACRALAQDAAIDDLILWAVPAKGRILLREQRAYAGMIAARNPQDAQPSSEGDLELVGFLMTGETAAALGELQISALELPQQAGRRVLLLDRDKLPVDKQLREHFEQGGAEVTVASTSDFGTMMNHPQESQTPEATIARTIAWLEGGPHATVASTRRQRTAQPDSIRIASDEGELRETPLRFESDLGEMWGVLTDRPQSETTAVCAVLLNGGAVWRIGPNRTWVELARAWAARGIPTVRVDLPGIGDSDGDERVLLPNRCLYTPQRNEQTLALIDQLAAKGLGERFILGGLCTGAYWSLHAALRDRRVAGALMINLYALYWSEELVAERDTRGSLNAMRGYGWRRLLRGNVDADQLKTVLASMRPGRIRAGAGNPVERAQSKDVELALDRLRDQGTQALMLLSRGEPLYDQLQRQGILDRLDAWPNLTVERIPSRDHMFRALWLQRHVREVLDRAVDRMVFAIAR